MTDIDMQAHCRQGYIYKRKHLTLSWTFIRKMETSNLEKPFSSSTLSHAFSIQKDLVRFGSVWTFPVRDMLRIVFRAARKVN
ncbi:hypothetical protein SKAU_G00329190 [Synaphobranchus kaupii]|uniref:Uncharacterized protein n=1 Tax=Synaphobranchus kaupii TaxID=118154 RepID=A0A9Q1IKJ7_SYNKA|nr:hypothetical protein SKAU_G00329190 [Synaphobranchus kaupii]